MNDFTVLGIFLACLIATLGFLRICEWLRPREQARGDSGSGASKKGARR